MKPLKKRFLYGSAIKRRGGGGKGLAIKKKKTLKTKFRLPLSLRGEGVRPLLALPLRI